MNLKMAMVFSIIGFLSLLSCKEKNREPLSSSNSPQPIHHPSSLLSVSIPPEVQIKERASQWSGLENKTGLGDRYAILVGANQYINKPQWDVPFVVQNLKVLKKTLIEDLKFHSENIIVLQGEYASRDKIESSVKKIFQNMEGKNNLIIFYYCGHGVVDENKTQNFFTYYSDEEISSSSTKRNYTGTITDQELQKLFVKFKTGLPAIGFKHIFILDACQVTNSVLVPVSSDIKIHIIDEIILTSCKLGQFATVNKKWDLSLFTDQLCKVLKKKSEGTRIDLESVFQEVKKNMAREIDARIQEPDFSGNLKEIELFSRKIIPVRFEVYSALQPDQMLSAELKINQKKYSSPVSLKALPEGKYFLSISNPGFFPRMEEFYLSPARHGQTMKIYLSPQISIIHGVIKSNKGEMPADVEASISGSFTGVVPGYHKQAQKIESEKPFYLVVPVFDDSREIWISQSGKILARRGLHRYEIVKVEDKEIRLYSAGRIEVSPGQGNELPDQVEIRNEKAKQTYQIIRTQMNSGNYASVLPFLDEFMDEAEKWGDKEVLEKFHEVGIQICRRILEEGLKILVEKGNFSLIDSVSAVIKKHYVSHEGLKQLREEAENEKISLKCRRAYESGLESISKANLEEAETQLLKALAETNEFYKKRIMPRLEYLQGRLYLKYRLMGLSNYNRNKWNKAGKYFLIALKYQKSSAMQIILEREILPKLEEKNRKEIMKVMNDLPSQTAAQILEKDFGDLYSGE